MRRQRGYAHSLKELLSGGEYLDTVCANLYQRVMNNPVCAACEHFRYCNGGCMALGTLYSPEVPDVFGSDLTKCVFYRNGWYRKAVSAMSGWRNETEIRP